MSDQEKLSPYKLPPYFLVFDVESIGLHGAAFSAGYVVIDCATCKNVAEGQFRCPPQTASGKQADRDWVMANVPHVAPNCKNPRDVREQFWALWMEWKQRGAALLADCAWPVEARFLIECINDDRDNRNWEGPYPLYDLAPMVWMLGRDPLAAGARFANEMPLHDPLNDARQSARVLAVCLTLRM